MDWDALYGRHPQLLHLDLEKNKMNGRIVIDDAIIPESLGDLSLFGNDFTALEIHNFTHGGLVVGLYHLPFTNITLIGQDFRRLALQFSPQIKINGTPFEIIVQRKKDFGAIFGL